MKEYGGVWIDATCFLSKSLPHNIFNYNFYSLNGAYTDLKWKWTSWFMVAKKGDLLVENMCRFYEAYWNKYHTAITYLFLDCWILAMYNNIPNIKKEIDEIPYSGEKCFSIICKWHNIYSENLFKSITDTYFINKLTYKPPLPKEIDNGRVTIYGKLLKMYSL